MRLFGTAEDIAQEQQRLMTEWLEKHEFGEYVGAILDMAHGSEEAERPAATQTEICETD